MNEPTHNVHLTDAEIVLLDGRARPEVQPVVEAAKARLAAMAANTDLDPKLAAFIADVVRS